MVTGRFTPQIKMELSCRSAGSVTWKWSTLSQLVALLYQDFLEKKTPWRGGTTKVAEEYLKYAAAIDTHNHYRNGNANLKDVWLTKSPPQKAIRWYTGVLLYQCLLSYEVFWKKQAATLTVQDNSFDSAYAVWICKPASNQATECIIWASSSFIREIALL